MGRQHHVERVVAAVEAAERALSDQLGGLSAVGDAREQARDTIIDAISGGHAESREAHRELRRGQERLNTELTDTREDLRGALTELAAVRQEIAELASRPATSDDAERRTEPPATDGADGPPDSRTAAPGPSETSPTAPWTLAAPPPYPGAGALPPAAQPPRSRNTPPATVPPAICSELVAPGGPTPERPSRPPHDLSVPHQWSAADMDQETPVPEAHHDIPSDHRPRNGDRGDGLAGRARSMDHTTATPVDHAAAKATAEDLVFGRADEAAERSPAGDRTTRRPRFPGPARPVVAPAEAARSADASRPDQAQTVSHGGLLLTAAGVASVALLCHRDTWEFIAERIRPQQHFRAPSAVADVDHGLVEVSLSGRSLIAVLSGLWEIRYESDRMDGDWALAATVYHRIDAALTQAHFEPGRGTAHRLEIVLDDGADRTEPRAGGADTGGATAA